MNEKIIEALAEAMVMAQVDVCGIAMFQAPHFAKEVIENLREYGYEICPASPAPDTSSADSASSSKS